MSDPRSITADAIEILVTRELRKAGVEPVGMHRRRPQLIAASDEYAFDLLGRLQAYDHRWSALIECRNTNSRLHSTDVIALRERASSIPAASALLCTTTDIDIDTARTARDLAVPLLRIADAQRVLTETGMIQPGQLPAWVPEFTIELVTCDAAGMHARLLESDQPELLLRELRANG